MILRPRARPLDLGRRRLITGAAALAAAASLPTWARSPRGQVGLPPLPAWQLGYLLRTAGPGLTYGGAGANWFDHNFYRTPDPNVATQGANSTLHLTGGTAYGVATAHLTGVGRNWAGAAYGGGFYLELVVQTVAPIPGVQPWPAAAFYAIEDTAPNAVDASTQWPVTSAPAWNSGTNFLAGQCTTSGGIVYRAMANNTNSVPPNANWALATAYGQGLEIDVFEADNSSLTTYGNGGHSWYGPFQSGRPDVHTSFSAQPTSPNSFNGSSDLKFGFRWKKATAGVAGSGELAWYFNDVQKVVTHFDPYDASLDPPPALGSTAFSWIDNRHLLLVLNGGTVSQPMFVKEASIWQASDAGNLRQ